MTKRTFHFIACVNRPFLMEECRRYIDRLYVPEGWQTELSVVEGAPSMAAGYNSVIGLQPGNAPRTEDVPVRIYLHQDVFLVNRWVLYNLESIFSAHPDVGMVGVAGTKKMHPSGVWWYGEHIGCVYEENDLPYEEERLSADVPLQDAAVADGFFLATSVDIPWREDLFDGFDFYDVSQAYEMRKAGYRVAIPEMNSPWAVHDDGRVLSLYRYNHYRKIFLAHYDTGYTTGSDALTQIAFPPAFFEDEVRDGFFVPETMKRFWAGHLTVLAEVARICEHHNIRWWAAFGTLLGTVRHKGFIPWDDDIDIVMFRTDLQRFLEIAKAELPAHLGIRDVQTQPEYNALCVRVTSTFLDEGHLEHFHGSLYSASVDIFAFDNVFEDPEKEQERMRRLGIVCSAGAYFQPQGPGADGKQHTLAETEPEKAEQAVRRVEELFGIRLDRKSHLFGHLLQLIVQMFRACPDENSEDVVLFMDNEWFWRKKRAWFRDTVWMPFEHAAMPVCTGYEEELAAEYGDWHVKVRGGGHGKAAYQEQEEYMRRKTGKNMFRYTFSPEDLHAPRNLASRIPDGMRQNAHPRREIVFLPVRTSWWPAMEAAYRMALEWEDTDVYVVPLPWYACDETGKYGPEDRHDESGGFPDYVKITPAEACDIRTRRPDMIVTQFPYEALYRPVQIDPLYYASSLRQLTEHLVYIPCYEPETPAEQDITAKRALRYLIEQPAVVFSDSVLLPTEDMRRLYIDVMSEIAGEDTKQCWEERFRELSEFSKV